MRLPRIPVALCLVAGSALHGAGGYLTIENRTAARWILQEQESKGLRGSWAPAKAGDAGPAGTIAPGSALTVRIEIPAGATAPDLHLSREGSVEPPLPLALGTLDWDAPCGARFTFLLKPEGTLVRKAGPAFASPLPTPGRAQEESPPVPLDIREEPRIPEPLAGIPVAWQACTTGMPRMAVINASPAAWAILPWESNGRSFMLKQGGGLVEMAAGARHWVPPNWTSVFAAEGPHAVFGLMDTGRAAPQALVCLDTQGLRLVAPPSQAPGGPPPGVFRIRAEDSQSFVIVKGAYPPPSRTKARAFPPLPAHSPVRQPSPAGAQADPQAFLDLEGELACEVALILLNESASTWHLDPLEVADGGISIREPDGEFLIHPRDARIPLQPGERTILALGGETGRFAVQDALSRTVAVASVDADGVTFGAGGDRTAPGERIRPIPGTTRSFVITGTR
ncbi:hypothetical protein [Mesoterricola silvestris]|uniref:Uncharacterized protein n=1 Tax=Mesoterricola silvestris TaxID=2927979 RepID=A0AA48K8A3_9BACT|nr:hypothetical protein [Mesoterricola silvestris]BDU72724.1 hypothetical protein METEAL_18980 [Mesoterricola silvestris]